MVLGVLLIAAAASLIRLSGPDVDGSESTPGTQDGLGGREAVRDRPHLRTVLVRTRRPQAALARPGQGPPSVASGAAQAVRPDYVPGRLLVKFEDDVSRQAAGAVLAGAGADPERQLRGIDVQVVDVSVARTGRALAELEASPAVEYVERDVAMQSFDTIPNDSLWPEQWGPALVNAPKAWDTVKGSAGIVIAVLDTGLEAGHPDLQGAAVPGHDFVNNDADPSDDEGHGTASAGVISARTNNDEGQAGICWRCSIMPIKVLDANGEGDSASLAAGIVWAADHGARVINMSLGGEATTQTLAEAVGYAARKGIVLVASAGNSGSETPIYPAAYPQVLSVAGTTETDGLYSWSNFGSWVKLAAPGCNTAPWVEADYVNFCGTSSSAPLVAGLAGLALSAKPEATSDEVEQAIAGTAVPLAGGVRYGRIDVRGALAALPGQPPASPPDASPPPEAANPEAIFQGRLTARFRQRRYVHLVTGEGIVAKLSFAGIRSLTLALVGPDGKVVARVAGRSPLRLARALEPGAYELVVRAPAARKARFALTVSSAGS